MSAKEKEKQETPESTKKKYKTLMVVRHNGKRRPKDTEIELTDKQAKGLLDAKAITPVEEK